MKTLFTIVFLSFCFFLAAQNDSTNSTLLNSSWQLTGLQRCRLDDEDAIDECSDTLSLLDKQILLTFLSEKKLEFLGEEFYFWMPTGDSLLLAAENWSEKRKTLTIGYMDMVLIFQLNDKKLYLEETILGVYGEYGDFTYGEINRYFFVKN
mgnify:CR=1 FL=1